MAVKTVWGVDGVSEINLKLEEIPGVCTRQEVVETAVSVPTVMESPRALIEKGALAPSLQGMQDALAKFMGPMAQIIFLECVEKWLENHQPSHSTLVSLVDRVVEEIGDPVKIADYRQRVSIFLSYH